MLLLLDDAEVAQVLAPRQEMEGGGRDGGVEEQDEVELEERMVRRCVPKEEVCREEKMKVRCDEEKIIR